MQIFFVSLLSLLYYMNLINYDPHKKTHPVNPLILEILIQTKKTHPVHPHNPGNPDSDK